MSEGNVQEMYKGLEGRLEQSLMLFKDIVDYLFVLSGC